LITFSWKGSDYKFKQVLIFITCYNLNTVQICIVSHIDLFSDKQSFYIRKNIYINSRNGLYLLTFLCHTIFKFSKSTFYKIKICTKRRSGSNPLRTWSRASHHSFVLFYIIEYHIFHYLYLLYYFQHSIN